MTKRIFSQHLDSILGKELKVLDKGFVRVVDYMGDDSSIVQSARVSYGRGTKKTLEDRGLIRFLLKNSHTTPFESCYLKLHIKCPIFIARQIFRHRTFSYNEISARYSIIDDDFYIPNPERIKTQSEINKQESSEENVFEADKICNDIYLTSLDSYDSYKSHIEKYKVAREIARIQLPQNIYTQFYMGGTLHNWFHFLKLRIDDHAQQEIQEYAKTILYKIIKDWLPISYEAFIDYQLKVVKLSRHELQYIINYAKGKDISENLLYLSKREIKYLENLLS